MQVGIIYMFKWPCVPVKHNICTGSLNRLQGDIYMLYIIIYMLFFKVNYSTGMRADLKLLKFVFVRE